jgi:hypothetical protein
MRCPFCDLADSRGRIHRHLVERHGAAVGLETHEAEGRMAYVVACPACGGEIRHQVKPRWRDPGFLEEFGPEIRLVAFDLLLHHFEDAHPAPTGA